MRPALPRYNVTWNVNIVLNYLRTRIFEWINFVTCIAQVVNVTCTIVWTERSNIKLVRHKKYLYIRLCENWNLWPFKNIKSWKTYWGVKFSSLPKRWKIVYCPSYETLSRKNKRSEKNCYHFIYRDAETPQRGVARYYWNVDEISHVRGRNRHQHIQTPQHKDGIIRAQTPDGYCSKDCSVEKWQCFLKILK